MKYFIISQIFLNIQLNVTSRYHGILNAECLWCFWTFKWMTKYSRAFLLLLHITMLGILLHSTFSIEISCQFAKLLFPYALFLFHSFISILGSYDNARLLSYCNTSISSWRIYLIKSLRNFLRSKLIEGIFSVIRCQAVSKPRRKGAFSYLG